MIILETNQQIQSINNGKMISSRTDALPLWILEKLSLLQLSQMLLAPLFPFLIILSLLLPDVKLNSNFSISRTIKQHVEVNLGSDIL